MGKFWRWSICLEGSVLVVHQWEGHDCGGICGFIGMVFFGLILVIRFGIGGVVIMVVGNGVCSWFYRSIAKLV